MDMDMLPKYKGYNHALYCLVIVMIFESTPTFLTHTNTFFSNMDKNNDSPGNRLQLHEKLQSAAWKEPFNSKLIDPLTVLSQRPLTMGIFFSHTCWLCLEIGGGYRQSWLLLQCPLATSSFLPSSRTVLSDSRVVGLSSCRILEFSSSCNVLSPWVYSSLMPADCA